MLIFLESSRGLHKNAHFSDFIEHRILHFSDFQLHFSTTRCNEQCFFSINPTQRLMFSDTRS